MANGDPELVELQNPPQKASPVGIGQPEAEVIEEMAPQAGLFDIVKCDMLTQMY